MKLFKGMPTPSPAMVVALIALFVALGGVGYAAVALPANSVGTSQLKNGAVTPPKLAKKTTRLFVPSSGLRRVGPIVSGAADPVPIASIGPFSLKGHCYDTGGMREVQVALYEQPSGPNSGFTARQEGGSDVGVTLSATSNANMTVGTEYVIAKIAPFSYADHAFGSVSGTVASSDGTEIFFHVDFAQNALGRAGCTYGGAFEVG